MALHASLREKRRDVLGEGDFSGGLRGEKCRLDRQQQRPGERGNVTKYPGHVPALLRVELGAVYPSTYNVVKHLQLCFAHLATYYS